MDRVQLWRVHVSVRRGGVPSRKRTSVLSTHIFPPVLLLFPFQPIVHSRERPIISPYPLSHQ